MSEDVVDLIVGDLVRETNIFPNQVERAKELIRERLAALVQERDAWRSRVLHEDAEALQQPQEKVK